MAGKLDRCSESELNNVINRMFDNAQEDEVIFKYLPWKDVWSCGGKENRRSVMQARTPSRKVLEPQMKVSGHELNRMRSHGEESCPGTPEFPRKCLTNMTNEQPRLTSMYSQVSGFEVETHIFQPRTPARPPPSPPR